MPEKEISTENIWNMFCCKLKPYIFNWISDSYIADEIIQEVFIKVHEKVGTLEDATKVKGWVLQITKNTVFDYLRKKKIRFEDIDQKKVMDENTLIDVKDKNERNFSEEIESGLLEMINTLPEKYAQALILVEYKGLSQIELAKKLNLSPSGAKSRVQRARQMIKDKLLNCCHYEFDKYGTIIGEKQDDCKCCKP